MKAPLPQSMSDVINRMTQLQYTSRIRLDKQHFDKIAKVIQLMERVDAELPAKSTLRSDKDYKTMLSYRRIDSFKVIDAELGRDLANASDFSRSSIEGRIEVGYDDAKRQGVASPLS
jgi:hypothetical protein